MKKIKCISCGESYKDSKAIFENRRNLGDVCILCENRHKTIPIARVEAIKKIMAKKNKVLKQRGEPDKSAKIEDAIKYLEARKLVESELISKSLRYERRTR